MVVIISSLVTPHFFLVTVAYLQFHKLIIHHLLKKVPLILLLLLLEDFPTFYLIVIYFLATLCSMWNLSSLIRDRTHTRSSGSMES